MQCQPYKASPTQILIKQNSKPNQKQQPSKEMLTTRLSSAVVASASSSSTLLLNPRNGANLPGRTTPSIANPLFYNSLRPIIEWSFGSKFRSRNKMDASVSRIASPRASAQQLKDPDQLIDSVETFIFDCDGNCFFFHRWSFSMFLNSDVNVGLLPGFFTPLFHSWWN